MDTSKRAYAVDKKLQFAAIAYYAMMLAAFVIGLYGLFSLFWLASAEIQNSVHIVTP
ncbi:MAG: hypothetical protein WAV20_13190 [Blastocatellia bacterium]